MRPPSIVALAVSIGLGLLPGRALAGPADSEPGAATTEAAPAEPGGETDADKARQLYRDGEKDYRRGRFKDALAKFEQSYDLSEQPLLLYNIALAHQKLYGVTGDIGDLRRSRAVLDNFMLFAEKDPSIDRTDATRLMAEVDAMIEKAEAEADDPGDPDIVVPPPDLPPEPTGSDPGRKSRIAGAVVMGTGGVLIVAGAVAGIFYGIKGSEFAAEVRQLDADQMAACAEGTESRECRQNESDIDFARSNGRAANLGLGLSLGLGGGLGLVALATGAVLFVQGNRRTKEWRAGTRPGVWLVPSPRGLAIRGRF